MKELLVFMAAAKEMHELVDDVLEMSLAYKANKTEDNFKRLELSAHMFLIKTSLKNNSATDFLEKLDKTEKAAKFFNPGQSS